MLTTDRLILRQWTEDDFAPFYRMCSDPDVMEFFPSRLTEEESDAMARKIQSLIQERDWGFWAVELRGLDKFIGFTGLHMPRANLPFAPCVEVGWRLAKEHWNKGYATEAATAALHYAFEQLVLDEVVSFTAQTNQRSQAVMEKLGMSNAGENFMHPDVPDDSSLREHVLYRITRSEWQEKYASHFE